MRVAIICPDHQRFVLPLAERLRAEPGISDVVLGGEGGGISADLVIISVWALRYCPISTDRATSVLVIAPQSTSTGRAALLNAGFDHVIHGHVSVPEVVAQVSAICRRLQSTASVAPDGRHRSGSAVEFDPVSRWARSCGRRVRLTEHEARLLLALMDEPGRTISHEQLLLKVWGSTALATSALSTSIRRLRTKLEPDPSRPTVIVTVRGAGYRLSRTPPAAAADPVVSDGPTGTRRADATYGG
jgi:DNA-binding response OmpR family regulator